MSPESLFWLLITTLYFSFFLFVCLFVGNDEKKIARLFVFYFRLFKTVFKKITCK